MNILLRIAFFVIVLCTGAIAAPAQQKPEYDIERDGGRFFPNRTSLKISGHDVRLDITSDSFTYSQTMQTHMGLTFIDIMRVFTETVEATKIGEIWLHFLPYSNQNAYYPTAKTLRLRQIFIDQAYQNQTFGTQALETLLAGINNVGCRVNKVTLEVIDLADIILVRWYEKHGFVLTDARLPLKSAKIMRLKKPKFPFCEKR